MVTTTIITTKAAAVAAAVALPLWSVCRRVVERPDE
jgi:hypothetical protein